MRRVPSGSTLILAAALFLAPVIGGQLRVDALPVPLGPGAFFSALMGGPELPTATHALLACAALAALGWVVARSRVLQTPNTRTAFALLLFVGFVIGSMSLSRFQAVSFSAMLEWTAYAGVFVAAVAVPGRRRGPRALLAALVGGCTLVALKGIAEYASMRAIDPTWRVFADWVNQNALAGMLLLGFLPALAFVVEGERVPRFLAGCAAALIGFALVLTQSKGGLLAAGVGLGLFVVPTAALGGPRRALTALAPCAVVVLLALGLGASQSGASQASALGRITNAASTEQQSAGFRRLLWEGSVRLIRQNPVGSGIGTYRYESAKSGLTQQTHLAHNTYLQLGVEVGVIGAGCFVAFLLLWLRQAAAGLRGWNGDSALRVGILSAVAASLAHNLVDSDLYHFGIGFAFFALLGLALSIAPDGAGPESVPRPVRWASVVVGCIGVGLAMLHTAHVEYLKARYMGAAMEGSEETVRETGRSLERWAAYDGEAWFLRAGLESEPIAFLSKAYALSPSPRFGRTLARSQARARQIPTAIATVQSVLRTDPVNFPALLLLMELKVQNGDLDGAQSTARRMVGFEQTKAFQVRAIPELVPTETLEARLFLESRSSDPRERVRLLQEAVQGYLRYAESTVPRVRQAAKTDPPSAYAGESLDEARAKMATAKAAAERLQKLLENQGDEDGARRAAEAAASFEAALN